MFSSPDNSSPMERRWVDDWLSVPRFDAYMSVCGDDVATALALYEWNTSLCQVLLKDLSHFEVALRNAYDRALDGIGMDRLIGCSIAIPPCAVRSCVVMPAAIPSMSIV